MSRRRRNTLKRGFALVALLAYQLAALGLAPHIDSALEARLGHSGQRFACEGHACGCVSAEQCWNSCCCFSVRERLVWATANHVAPPASFRDVIALERQDVASTGHSCCHATSLSPNAYDQLDAAATIAATAPEQHPPRSWPVMTPLQCRGLTTIVCALAPTVSSHGDVELIGRDAPVVTFFCPDFRAPQSRAIEIPPPPPRCA